MSNYKIMKSILKINSSAIVTVRGTDIDTCEIEWQEGTTPISKEDIKAQFPIDESELTDEEKELISRGA